MENIVQFCTCRYTKYPRHPMNNPKGCTDCIEKNLRLGEIPNCFFVKTGISEDRDGDSFESFAKEIMKKAKE